MRLEDPEKLNLEYVNTAPRSAESAQVVIETCDLPKSGM
jgi:hypothetical protein